MGLGNFPGGVGPLGFDPIQTSDGTRPVLPPATLYDLSTRSLVYTADGVVRGVHPVDQEVILRIGTKKGSVPSSPNLGLDVDRILRASRVSVANVARDEVRVALASPLAAGDIELSSVDVESDRGRVSLVVSYVNLRTKAPERVSVPL